MAVFGVRAHKPGVIGGLWEIHDTEEEARKRAEIMANTGCSEVSVWQQIAAVEVKKEVVWS